MGVYLGNGRIHGINVVAQTPDNVAQTPDNVAQRRAENESN